MIDGVEARSGRRGDILQAARRGCESVSGPSTSPEAAYTAHHRSACSTRQRRRVETSPATTRASPAFDPSQRPRRTAGMERGRLTGRSSSLDFWTVHRPSTGSAPSATCARGPTNTRRADRRRRPHAGVSVRARRRERALGREDMDVKYPIALDSSYAVWDAFATTTGRPCTSPTPKGGFAITNTGREATRSAKESSSGCFARRAADDIRRPRVVAPRASRRRPDWDEPGTPETYLGADRRRLRASRRRARAPGLCG